MLEKRIKKIWDNFFLNDPKNLENAEWVKLSTIVTPESLFLQLSHAEYPEHVLNELSKLGNPRFNFSIASKHNSSPETLTRIYNFYTKLFSGLDDTIKLKTFNFLARHKNTPHEILEQLYVLQDVNIITTLSFNGNIPARLAENIFYNYYKNVDQNDIESYIILKNPNLPEFCIREAYGKENNEFEQSFLARNSNLPEDIADEMYKKGTVHVRAALASHENRVHVLRHLLYDIELGVRIAATTNLFYKNFFTDWPKEWVEVQYGIKIEDRP